ncbi:hypothetical protein O1L44_04690 [Streptomyces noursei]|nr:hypothetical protein [Streptomyces noursei]
MSRPGSGAEQVVRVENGFGYGVIGADLHVFPDRGPVYLLSEYDPAAGPAGRDAGWLTAQPSRLLNARFQVVDFTGRDRERAGLAAWRDGAGPRLAATWLHGPGGSGQDATGGPVRRRQCRGGLEDRHGHPWLRNGPTEPGKPGPAPRRCRRAATGRRLRRPLAALPPDLAAEQPAAPPSAADPGVAPGPVGRPLARRTGRP